MFSPSNAPLCAGRAGHLGEEDGGDEDDGKGEGESAAKQKKREETGDQLRFLPRAAKATIAARVSCAFAAILCRADGAPVLCSLKT